MQTVTLDGEVWSETPVTARISDKGVNMIVPKANTLAAAA